MSLAAFIDAGGSGMVGNLLTALVVGIAILVIWWAGTYFIGAFGAPPLFAKIWNGLFVLLAVIFVVNFLMSLAGHGFIVW